MSGEVPARTDGGVAGAVAELPAGTLTMLFSDIEGSTALVRRLGERYGDALSAQRTLLRAAFGSFGGRELSTEGDSFFVVFESAVAAVEVQLSAEANPFLDAVISSLDRRWRARIAAGS